MQQIGRYEVLEEIARGGMGIVFRGRDPASGRKVAIKVLLNPDPDPRFQQEARSSARLQHPGIVFLYDMGRDDQGRDFLVMELVEGESLQDRLERDGPLPIDEAVEITLQLCEAMGYAHQRGVIHRDLKPHNVLITPEGVTKITDFGLGKVIDQTVEPSRPSLTMDGQIMGTAAYMAPEQAAGEKARVGPQSDIYSLGATLYALLTGRPPFKAKIALNLIVAVLDKTPEPPSQHRADIPPWLDAAVLRCLEKEPEQRFEGAEELAEALAGGPKPGATPIRSTYRGGAACLALASVVFLGLAGALVLAAARESAEPPTTLAPNETALAEPAEGAPRQLQTAPLQDTPGEAAPSPTPTASHVASVEADGAQFTIKSPGGDVLGAGTVSTADCPYPKTGSYVTAARAVGNVVGDSAPEVVLMLHHKLYYPALVVVLEADGREVWRYWHPGWLMSVSLQDHDGDGVAEIYAAGVNDRLASGPGRVQQQVALCLDVAAGSPPSSTRYHSPERGPERWYTPLGMARGKIRRIRTEGEVLVLPCGRDLQWRVRASDGVLLSEPGGPENRGR